MRIFKPGDRSPEVGSKSLTETPTPESRAERLLAEYLRVWGLRDPQTIATLSSSWVRRAAGAFTGERQKPSLTELYRAAMREAIGDIRRRLDDLTGELSSSSGDVRSCRGLVAIELQSVIDQFPAALLARGPLPPALFKQLAGSALAVVPASSPTYMPTQSLETISSSKYLSRWRDAFSDLWSRLRRPLSRSDEWPRLRRDESC